MGKASTTDLEGLPSGPYEQNNGWHAKGIWAMFGWVLLCYFHSGVTCPSVGCGVFDLLGVCADYFSLGCDLMGFDVQ